MLLSDAPKSVVIDFLPQEGSEGPSTEELIRRLQEKMATASGRAELDMYYPLLQKVLPSANFSRARIEAIPPGPDGLDRGPPRGKTDDDALQGAAVEKAPRHRRLGGSEAPPPQTGRSALVGKAFAASHLSREGQRQNRAWRQRADHYMSEKDAPGLYLDIAQRYVNLARRLRPARNDH